MIIDIHTRIGQHPLHDFKQEPKELIAIMDEYGIDKSFLLPFPTMRIKENNDMIAKAVGQNPEHFVGFAGINPSAEDAPQELERCVDLGHKGLMIDPEFHKGPFRDLSKLEVLMVPCVEHSLPVLFNTENIHTMTRLEQPNINSVVGLDSLAFKFPDVRLIVNCFWPRVGELMRQHRNIILYTGGHHNVPGPIPRIEEVGPMRICLGSESPVNHPALTIRDLSVKKIEPVYRELILGKNSQRLFNDLL